MIAIVSSEVELRYTQSKKKVGTFSVGIPTVRNDETTWETFSVEVWEGTAEACSNYLTKGSKVLLSAVLKQSRWMADGQPRSRVYLRASQVEFIRLKGAEESSSDTQ